MKKIRQTARLKNFNVLQMGRAIKLTSAFLLLWCLQLSAAGFTQDKVSLNLKSAKLEKALDEIQKQTGYRFLYKPALVDGKKVDVSVANEEVTAVLNLVLNDNGIGYQMLGNKLIALRSTRGEGIGVQDIRITGKVTGTANEPLANISVTVKGTGNGTTTDAAGNYSITVPNQSAVLVFSSVGFAQQEIPVGGRTTINVTLSTSASELNTVVVVGYGTQRKRDVTGSITSIRGDEIARQPNTNPVSSLQGKVAGLTIVNSGRAGSSPTVRIRGVNSTGVSDPLYVVDGVFQTNVDYLNPADIESIEVLRDPSSIAIFGLQGGNGVIIVTTKRAGRGQTRISFQSSVGVQKVIHKIDLVDAAGFKKLYAAQLANLNAGTFDFTNYTANTNWQDQIFRSALINNNSLTISNSSEKSSTLFNLGYNTQEGVLKYDKFQKFIVRLNQELRISNNLRIGGDLTGFHYIRNNYVQDDPGAVLNYALRAAPIVPIQAGPGLYYSMPSFQRAQIANPVARIDQFTNTSVNKGYRAVGSVFGEVKFLKNFTFRSTFYADLSFANGRTYNPLPYRYVNLGEGASRTDTSFNNLARTSVGQSSSESRKFQQDHTLTFEKSFNKHRITALAGFTTLYLASSNVSGSRTDTLLNIPNDPNLWYLGIVGLNSNVGSNSGGGSEEAYLSYLARVNYSFNNKYLVNATYRRDGNSKFGPSNKWGNFGSVGLGWVVSEEDFFKNVKALNFLKLRGAWGTVGNALGLSPNLYQTALTTANTGVFGDNVYSSVAPVNVKAPTLHWETVRGIDVGLEARAIKNKLNADITFYDRKTNDLITTITLLGTAGSYPYVDNLGSVTNRGIEVTLGWNDKIGRDFTYRINGNFSYNKNFVNSIGPNFDFQILGNGGVNRTVTGQSIGYFYGYRQTGIYQTVASLDKTPAFVNSLPGDISYADLDGDGVITDKDRTYLGTPFPPYNFGGSISLGYKGFDFLIEGQGVAGNKIYTQRRTATFAVLNYEANRLNAWSGAGTSNVEPILDNTRGNNFLFSSYYLESGDYFRLRTLQLGYNFSSKVLGKAIKQLRFYVSGQNIATFTRATGYTPEVSLGSPIASGADNGTYPVPAIYTVGVNLTF